MQQWDKIKEEGLAIIRHADNLSRIEQVRIDLLGKKGQIQDLMKQMKDLDNHQKPLFGKMVNELKQLFEEEISIKKNELEETKILTDLKRSNRYKFRW